MNPTKEYFTYNLSTSNDKLRAALLTHVYKQGHIGLIASLLCATILLLGLYPIQNHTHLIAWYIVFLGITLFRFTIIKLYFQQSPAQKNLIVWHRLYVLGAFLGGCSWGFICGVMFPYPYPMQLILTVLILAGVTAGAVPVLSGSLISAIAFLIPAILPLNIRLLFVNEHALLLYNIALFIYLIYLITLAIKSHKTIAHSISLQFENDALLTGITDANNQLEISNKKLSYYATHDLLTGLVNRYLFHTLLNESLHQAQQKNTGFALLYFDIDHFKEVNDRYSHHIGDLLLQSIAERIRQILPEQAEVARFGGDEFTIIVKNINDLKQIRSFAQEICKIIALPFVIKNYPISISTSIGISLYPVDGSDAETLLKNADNAMYYIKAHNGNNYQFNSDLATVK